MYPINLVELDNLWVMEAPVLSTAHLTPEDRDLIFNHIHSLNVQPLFADWEKGTCIFHLCAFEQDGGYDSLSPAFRELVETFLAKEVSYLRFDPDGDLIPGLPQYPDRVADLSVLKTACEDNDLPEDALDDAVHELAAEVFKDTLTPDEIGSRAASINNEGRDAQLRFLLEHNSRDAVESILEAKHE